MAPARFGWNLRYAIFKFSWVIDVCGITCEFTLKRLSHDFTDDKSTLVQVMVWCCEATNHYLSQCWPTSTRPLGHNESTYWDLVLHVGRNQLAHHCLRKRLFVCSTPSHYQHQCWFIIKWAIRKKNFRKNVYHNINIKDTIWKKKMSVILCLPAMCLLNRNVAPPTPTPTHPPPHTDKLELCLYYSDIIRVPWHLGLPATWLFVQ